MKPALRAALAEYRNRSGVSVLSVIFTKSTLSCCRRSIALSASALLPTSIVPFQTGLMPSIFAPDVSRRGPNSVPLAISPRHCSTCCGRSPEQSRIVVMPWAMYSGSSALFSSTSAGPPPKCTCMSHRPGIRYLPLASIWRLVLHWLRSCASGPTATMSSPRMTTLCPGTLRACSTSTTVALRISRSARSAADADSGATTRRMARDNGRERNMDSILVGTAACGWKGRCQRVAPCWRSRVSMLV
ncbi:hypothetical protein D3C81_1071420 [compost metagenome]